MRYLQDPAFMKRANLSKDKAPVIENRNGSVSTHRMAAEKYKGEWYAFPTVVQQKDGKLKEYEDPFKALKANLKVGNAMRFGKDKDAAIKFAKGGYKQGTPMETNPILKALSNNDANALLATLADRNR